MNFHTHIQPQLDSIISDALGECNPEESFLEALQKPRWYTHPQFKDMPLHYGKREYSIEEWADITEALENEAFIPQLKQQLTDTVKSQWQIRLKEWDEDLRYQESLLEEEAAVA